MNRFRISRTILPVCMAIAVSAGMLHALQPSGEHTPETDTLNRLWDDSLAAGNYDDWYRNCDEYHSALWENNYPQLNSYGNPGYTIGYERSVVDSPRTVIGNASLAGDLSLISMCRVYGASQATVERHYKQYTNNQHYWYPAAWDYRAGTDDRDKFNFMYPYVSHSEGQSSSEQDELRKFFHTLAAFKPATKEKLKKAGLLIPALQMIFRRTRVASDSAYLTGTAHPSAFGDNPNNLAMIQMAQRMDTAAVPPMVRLTVEDESFGEAHATRYNDSNKSERLFTSPASIARVFRGPGYTKWMEVDAGGSFDIDGHPLTWHWAVLRGDPAHTRIIPLTADSARVRIEIDYRHSAITPGTNRLSALVVVGAFVHNGTYFSAPAFITSLSLYNETRTYSDAGLIESIDYTDEDIRSSVSSGRSWDSDHYYHDFNGGLYGWWRRTGRVQKHYTREGYLVDSLDRFGRPAAAHEVIYTSSPSEAVARYDSTRWQRRMTYAYSALATGRAAPLDLGTVASIGTLSEAAAPENGVLNASCTYTPDDGFTGVERVSLMERDTDNEFTVIHRIRIAVGPADADAPATVTGVGTYGSNFRSITVYCDAASDNRGVAGYRLYRNGTVVGTSFVSTAFTDTALAAGDSAVYAVTAFDDAGNESVPSAGITGRTGELWGQDDFADGDYTEADSGLEAGIAWNLVHGSGTISSGKLVLGSRDTVRSFMVTSGAVAPPFSFEFRNSQQYVGVDQGPVVLYQDTSNCYYFILNRARFALYRIMDGDTVLLGSNADLAMQHQASAATFGIRVTATGDGISFSCQRRNWTESPDGTADVTFTDTAPAALARFATGAVGFARTSTVSSWGVGTYDDIFITRHTGTPPGGPVPVVVSGLAAAAAGEDVEITWNTAGELNSRGFNVLRASSRSGPFGRVNGTLIPGAGTTVLPRQYSFTDSTPGSGIWYYRIAQMDSSGGERSSGVVTVDMATVRVRGADAAGGGVPELRTGTVYDLYGRPAGRGGSGVYFFRTETGTGKMLIVR